tara:strand:+ start:239 stop:496 length:258 start_codon:yes stop_codon:yes gene_type:complete
MEDWREFRNMIEYDSFHMDRDRLLKGWPFLEAFNCPEEWIQHRAEISNDAQIEFEDLDISGNAKPTRSKPKRGKLARLMGRLWPK